MSEAIQAVRFDYGRIKEMAKELGCPIPDLLALARQNDPFYVGTPGDIAQAHTHDEWIEVAQVDRAVEVYLNLMRQRWEHV